MRVLVIPTWYPSGEDKLMGIYHKEFTSALNKNGISADILFIDRQRLKDPFKYLKMPKRQVVEEENYTTYIHNILNLRPLLGFDLQMKHYVKALDKAFKMYLKDHPRPDVLHAQVTVPAGYAAVKLGEKYDIPVVVTEHGGLLERFFKDEPFKKYGLYVLEHSTYTTVSHYMKNIALRYTDDCTVLPNQVNTKLFKNDLERHIDGTFNLIMVCALREGKRLDVAFDSLKMLKEEHFDVHLDIIGDGFYEETFKRSAKEKDVEDMVTFHGRKEKNELPAYLEKAHALLISSDIESFAIPGIEAMASGLPVISTDCLGPRDFVNDKTGFLCQIGDSVGIKNAIKQMKENYESYRKEDLEKMADSFSEENVVASAKKIYKKAIEKGSKKGLTK